MQASRGANLAVDFFDSIQTIARDAALTAAAITILALGIGPTTLVYSLANGLLRPLPAARAHGRS